MHLMLFQDFQTTSGHHEFPRWSNHPPCNRSLPPDQTIREGKHLPVPFQYLVSLSHDLLRGPRKHRVRNGEGRCSCLSVTGLHGLSAGWRAGDHRSACPRSHGKLEQPHDLVGTEWGTHSPAGLPPAPVPGLPLGAGMTPYDCRGEALMEEFTGSQALTKIHGRHLYTFPQRWNKNLTWFFKVDSNQAALCFPHTDCVFKKQVFALNISFFCSLFPVVWEFLLLVWDLVCIFLPLFFLTFFFLAYRLWCTQMYRVTLLCPTICLLQVLHFSKITENARGGAAKDRVSHSAPDLEDHVSKRVIV